MPDETALEIKAAPLEIKAEGDAGEYEGHFAVFGNVDDGGDRSHKGMFAKTLQERGRRVKVLYAHDWSKLIGPAPNQITEDESGLFAKGRITLNSFWGKEAWALMKDGVLDEGSFGYRTVKADFGEDGIRNLYEVALYEISPVPLGMNALTQVRAVKGALLDVLKAAMPVHHTAKAADDTAWDAAAVLKECESATQLRRVHAWVDPEGDPEAKASYKLPHHLPNGQVVWSGVAAAGAALMGARGGVMLPEGDLAGVKRHLAAHYKQFEKIPPWDESAGVLEFTEAAHALAAEIVRRGLIPQCDAFIGVDDATSFKKKLIEIDETLKRLTDLLPGDVAPNPAVEPQANTLHSTLALVKRVRAAEQALAAIQQRHRWS